MTGDNVRTVRSADPPPCPAAASTANDDPWAEHAQPGRDKSTLCRPVAESVTMFRHLFGGKRPGDCLVCAERVWLLPRWE